MTFNPKSGGLWGRTGAAIDSNGVAWAPTGDGRYDPANADLRQRPDRRESGRTVELKIED